MLYSNVVRFVVTMSILVNSLTVALAESDTIQPAVGSMIEPVLVLAPHPPLDLNYYGPRGKPQTQPTSTEWLRKELNGQNAMINESQNGDPTFQQIYVPMDFEQTDLLPAALAVTAITLITLTGSEKKLLAEVQSHKNERNDRIMDYGKRLGEDLGKKLVVGSLILGVVIDENKKITELVPVELKAVIAVGLANNLLKVVFRRALPSDSPKDPYATGKTSRPPDLAFPSGHTSLMIVAATIAAHNLESLGPVIPALLYAAAAVTGVSRMYHNQHWATDVIASVYSYYLTKAILDGNKSSDPKYKLVIGPVLDPRTRQFGLHARIIERPEYKPCGIKDSGLARVEACVREATRKQRR